MSPTPVRHRSPPLLAAIAAACLAGAGCDGQRSASVQPPSPVTGITASRDLLTTTRNDVGVALGFLDLLNHQSDLTRTFTDFSTYVARITREAGTVKSQLIDMERDPEVYVRQWQAEAATTGNADQDRIAKERKQAVQDSFADTVAAYQALDNQLDPLVDQFCTIEQTLRQELSAGSLQALQGVTAAAATDGETVETNADAVLAKLERYQDRNHPTLAIYDH